MGKKNKKDKKQSGADKTARKTDKNLEKKMKKTRDAAGEEDIEVLIAKFRAEDRKKSEVTERKCDPPSARINFTFTPNRERDEIYIFGGEFHDGKKTAMFSDFFIYSVKKNEWRCLESFEGPPPRSAHQSVLVRSGAGDQLWVFGGEFVSPTETQFYHYKDLWCWHFKERRWEQVKTNSGPKARSGHRMLLWKKHLLLFGGFNDTGRSCAYFNDLWLFELSSRTWREVRPIGNPPAPRSACLLLPHPDGKSVCVVGGYCRSAALKGQAITSHGKELEKDKGHVFTDMFHATLVSAEPKGDSKKSNEEMMEARWRSVKWNGAKPDPPRAGMAAVTGEGGQAGCAFVFGGVHDQYEDAETVQSFFFNELFKLELERGRWHKVSTKRKKVAEEMEALSLEEAPEDVEMKDAAAEEEEMTVTEEGAFTLTVGGAKPEASKAPEDDEEPEEEDPGAPGPRMNSGLALLGTRLFLFGGQVETSQKERVLDDLHCLDIRKMDGWNCLREASSTTWVGEDSSGSEEEMDEDDDEEDDLILDAPAPTEGESFSAYWERTCPFWTNLIASEMADSEEEEEEADSELVRKYAMKTARDFHKGFAKT